MLTCRDVAARAVDLENGALGALDRFRLKLHILLCRHCRRRRRQMKVLIGAVRNLRRDVPDGELEGILRAAHALESEPGVAGGPFRK